VKIIEKDEKIEEASESKKDKKKSKFWNVVENHISSWIISQHILRCKIEVGGSIHDWGTKKECLTKKGVQRTTLNFCLSYIIKCNGLLYGNKLNDFLIKKIF
jgi:hypothetical protein